MFKKCFTCFICVLLILNGFILNNFSTTKLFAQTNNNFSISGKVIPDIPNISSFSSTSKNIILNWDIANNATSYEISIDNKIPINIGNITTYNHNNLQPNSSHIYKIRGKNRSGVSNWSNSVTAYTTAIEPQKIIINSSTNKEITVSVSKDLNSTGTQYNFGIFQNNTLIKETGYSTNNLVTIEGLQPNKTYDIKVATKSINGTTTAFKFLGTITIPDNKSTNGDLEVSATINPTIVLCISTNCINFGSITLLTNSYELLCALTIGVQSNNEFSIGVRVNDDFITIQGFKLPCELLNIREHNGSYTPITKGIEMDLVSTQAPTGGTQYNIDFKLITDYNVRPDNYSNIINFIINQL